MAGETQNIAAIAEKLAAEIFDEFFWTRVGPLNENFECVSHGTHDVRTHPCDVVFRYDNPYFLTTTYVACDLKSYKKSSITPSRVKAALTSLAKSIACAETSNEFRDRYLDVGKNAEVAGLLFMYNHDGGYDSDFRSLLREVKHQELAIPKRSKLVVLGPEDIFWLNNVYYEIVHLRGKGVLPAKQECQYFYPHLDRKKNLRVTEITPATLDMLTSPWIMLSYRNPQLANSRGLLIFYRGNGALQEQFLYLLDYLMHYQVFDGHVSVSVRTLGAHALAPSQFQKAVDTYIEECQHSASIKQILSKVEYKAINEVHADFSTIELGMRDA
jgi:hypothetical protein